MKVTAVKIVSKNTGEGKVKAFAQVTLENAIVINDIKVVDGENGLFIGMPSKKSGEKFFDTVYFLDKEVKKTVQDAVIAEY